MNIFASKIEIDSQDDVNAILRENGHVGAELCVTENQEYIITPAISVKMWKHYPWQKDTKTSDPNWENVVSKANAFLTQKYGSVSTTPAWIETNSIYRCPKQESFIRNLDLE